MYEAIADVAYTLGIAAGWLGISANVASLSVGIQDSSSRSFRQWYEKSTPEKLPGVIKPAMKTLGIISYPGYSL